MEYALIGYFDEGLDGVIRSNWKELKDKGLSNYGYEVKGKTPHVTFADFELDDISELIVKLEFLRRQLRPMLVLCTNINQFPNSTTLFYEIKLTEELLKTHFLVHATLERFVSKNSYYVPGKWVPHATIASRIEKVEDARALFKDKFILRGNITKLVLIKMDERIENVPQGFTEVWSAEL